MPILPILTFPNSILRKKAKPVNSFDKEQIYKEAKSIYKPN